MKKESFKKTAAGQRAKRRRADEWEEGGPRKRRGANKSKQPFPRETKHHMGSNQRKCKWLGGRKRTQTWGVESKGKCVKEEKNVISGKGWDAKQNSLRQVFDQKGIDVGLVASKKPSSKRGEEQKFLGNQGEVERGKTQSRVPSFPAYVLN